jgi:hypothetical protein
MRRVPGEPCVGSGAAAFHRRSGELYCEHVAVRSLAKRFGTPLYVYSTAAIDERLQRLRRAFGQDAHVCYAVKANPNLTLLQRMHAGGAGFDLVSGGELARLAAAGLPASGAVFAGVAKQAWEIEAAVRAGILFFNVESPSELPLLAAAGRAAGQRVRVASAAVGLEAHHQQRHHFERGEDAAKRNNGDRCAAEIEMVEGAEHAAAKEDNGGDQHRGRRYRHAHQPHINEERRDDRRGEHLEHPFDPQMHQPPAPIFHDRDVCVLAICEAGAEQQAN